MSPFSGPQVSQLSLAVPPTSNNEPTGMTLISNRQFNALNEGGWSDGGGANMSIVTDATAPESPSNVLDMHMPAGFGEGGGPGSGDFTISANYRTLYVRYSAKFSSNWFGSSSAIDKTFYLYNSLGFPSLYFTMEGTGNVAKRPICSGQNIINAGSPSPGGDLANPDWGTNVIPGFTTPLGAWHTIELVVVGNTSGTANGTMDWWCNGTKIGSVTGVQFVTGNQLWNVFHYTLLYSGATGSNPPSAQDLYWDNIYLSGK